MVLANASYYVACFKLDRPILTVNTMSLLDALFELFVGFLKWLQLIVRNIVYLTWLSHKGWILIVIPTNLNVCSLREIHSFGIVSLIFLTFIRIPCKTILVVWRLSSVKRSTIFRILLCTWTASYYSSALCILLLLKFVRVDSFHSIWNCKTFLLHL